MTVLAGLDQDWLLLSTSGGYGFLAMMKEMQTKNRTGKSLLSVPHNSRVMAPCRIMKPETDWVAVVTQQGRLLVFPAAEIPVLNKGKGNKLIQISGDDLANGADGVVAMLGFPPEASLKLHGPKRFLTLSSADLDGYRGARGRRGTLLPRGFQRIERLEWIA